MTDKKQPASTTERAAIADAAAALLRHDARNKVAGIRNAMFYLRRQLSGTEKWAADARVPQFFDIVDKELVALEETWKPAGESGPFRAQVCSISDIARGVVGAMHANIDAHVDHGVHARVDPEDAALALRCLLDDSLAAVGGAARVGLHIVRDATHAAIEVRDTGQREGGERPLEVAIARRFAIRYGGAFTRSRGDKGVWVTSVRLPNEEV